MTVTEPLESVRRVVLRTNRHALRLGLRLQARPVSACRNSKPLEFEGEGALIEQWLKNKDTVLFLGVWEQINNPGFNSLEFEGFRNEAGRNSFFLSARSWPERTRAKGLIASAGRYGGTFAHKDIAFEFGSWLSPEFKLYRIKEFQRLKDDESRRLSLAWNLNRTRAMNLRSTIYDLRAAGSPGGLGISHIFSLTPALSRWERENHSPSRSKIRGWVCRTVLRRKVSAQLLSPSPSGRGIKGEGERPEVSSRVIVDPPRKSYIVNRKWRTPVRPNSPDAS